MGATCGWVPQNWGFQCHNLSHHEGDLVLIRDDGKVVAVEVKLAGTVDDRDTRHLPSFLCAPTKCRVMVRRLGRVPAWAIWRDGTLRAT